MVGGGNLLLDNHSASTTLLVQGDDNFNAGILTVAPDATRIAGVIRGAPPMHDERPASEGATHTMPPGAGARAPDRPGCASPRRNCPTTFLKRPRPPDRIQRFPYAPAASP